MKVVEIRDKLRNSNSDGFRFIRKVMAKIDEMNEGGSAECHVISKDVERLEEE
jgi:hypothetical protein